MKFLYKVNRLGCFFLISVFSILLFNCKKHNDPEIVDVRDSAYYNTLIYYLWNQNLPDYKQWSNSKNGGLIPNSSTIFKPHNFLLVDSVMESPDGIRKYSELTSNGKNADRYSFAIHQIDWEKVSTGSNLGYGFRRKYISDSDLRIVYVFSSSPMGLAGVKRGWKILSINGISGTTANDVSIQNSLVSNSTSTFVFQLPDNTQKSIPITKAAYKADFILSNNIITVNTQKIGYISFYSFLGDNNGQTTLDSLTKIITGFNNAGVTDLVVDLRYNGGGYVSVSEGFANLLAPSTAKGKVMYSTKYNNVLTDYYNSKNIALTNNFNTSGSLLNLSRIVFITSGETASASELLINNLKPYMTVKLVGTTTYGKPVGFPGILIQMSKTDKTQNYYVFPISFQTVNANNEGGYFYGINVDNTQNDDVTHDFGDPNEANLKEAISYLTSGSFVRIDNSTSTKKTFNFNSSQEDLGGFNGMIQNNRNNIFPLTK